VFKKEIRHHYIFYYELSHFIKTKDTIKRELKNKLSNAIPAYKEIALKYKSRNFNVRTLNVCYLHYETTYRILKRGNKNFIDNIIQ